MLRSTAKSMEIGVTLIELLIVMAIAGILLAIAVPSYRYVTSSNRVAGEINALLGDMQFARYEAIKEGLPVKICAATSSTAATCGTTTDWSTNGWIVLSNIAASPAKPGENVLRRQMPFTTLNSKDTLAGSTGLTTMTFNREGFAPMAGSAILQLHDSTSNSSFTRCLIVNAAGGMTTTTYGKTFYSKTCS